MAVGNLFVRLGLKSKDYQQGIQKAGKHTKQLQKTTQGLSKSLLSMKHVAVAAFSAWGIQKIASSFLDAAKITEDYQVRLKVLLGSVEKGNQLFDDMSKFASSVSFEYKNVMGSATALAGVMTGGVAEINQWIPMIADLAAVSGLSIEETTGQVIRMYSAGAASADMFRERGILSMLGFQAGVKYTAEETRAALIKAFEDPQSKFKGASKELAKTWSGTMSMIHDKWFQVRNLVMDAGVYDELKKSLSFINDEMGDWIKNNKVLISQNVHVAVENIAGAVKITATAMGDLYDVTKKGYDLYTKIPENIRDAFFKAAIPGLQVLELYKQLKEESGGLGSFVTLPMPEMPKEILPTEDWTKQVGWFRENWLEVAKISEEVLVTWTEKNNQMIAFEQETQSLLLESKAQYYIDAAALSESALKADIGRMNAAARNEIQIEQQKIRAKQQIQTTWVNFAVSIANTLYALSDQQSKALFLLQQAAGIAQALVSAHVAAGMALASAPPPLSFALAKATLALGYANAAAIGALAIKNVGSVGGGGGFAGGGAVGTYPASPYTGQPDVPIPIEEERPTTTIIVQVDGDFYGDEEFIDRLADRINEAVETREVRVVSSEVKERG